MHGREGEERSRQLGNPHMRAAPSRLRAVRDSDGSLRSPTSSSQSFFCKDGRKISVGDCALFKLPQDSPPSIGLVCRVTVTKENNLKLGVNWLYRPTEVKLGKGILLEAAPNEVFYSFKEDEIPAASLLHPCKVAFLPKGAELPPGISYFVCRRVYDISIKRLWWLTDKSHFNEQIDHLLRKTQIEMHASTQPNGRSPKQTPKQTSGSVSTSHLKSAVDSPQNTTFLQSQSKGKKRERQDQSTDPLRRERSLKMGDGDYGCCSSESTLKSDIAKIVAKGPLVDTEGVDKLVQLMSFETNERKVDFSLRSMMTSVIVTTDKPDCLSRFVQIRGLPILDDWLQDVHKLRTSDSGNPKDNDKMAEEFLLVLFRALEKLPVNLHALQMCNIGKSVNHLRTHKNLEIQKKARSLVDTWKKRVEAEMNMNDAKTGSNQAGPVSARNRPSEVPHVNRSTGGSSEDAPKSPAVQLSASKTAPMKLSQGETASKSTSQFQVSVKLASPQVLAGVNPKDGQPRFGGSSSDVPPTTSRDEKSSSSSPSNNSSLSCSGDHAKNGNSAPKEDARNIVAASNKISLASRHRKSANGFPASIGSPQETGPSRTTSMHKNVAPDKASQSGLTSDKAADVVPEVNSHKFIVKIPNRTCSPARRVAVGSIDDSAMNSRPSSPIPSERPDQLDTAMEERADASQANMSLDVNGESLRENDFRDMNAHEEGGDGPADIGPSEEHPNTDESTNKVIVVPKNYISSPRNSLKVGKVPEATIDPMSALIESCVHYAEAHAPVPVGDDVGMHLLASVAAGEMLKSELESPAASPCGVPSLVEPPSEVNNPEMKPLPPDNHTWQDDHSKDVGGALMLNGGDGNSSRLFSSGQPVEEDRHLNSSSMDVDQLVIPSPWCNKVPNKIVVDCSNAEMNISSEGDGESKITTKEMVQSDELQDAKASLDSFISPVNGLKGEITGVKLGMENQVGSGREGRKAENSSDHCGQLEAKPGGEILSVETYTAKEQSTAGRPGAVKDSEMDAAIKNKQNQKHESLMVLEVQTLTGLGSETNELLDRKVVSGKEVSLPVSKPQMDLPLQDIDVSDKSRGCELPSSKDGEAEQCSSSDALASTTVALDGNTKLEFDLNEGLNADDCKFGESMNFNTTSSPAVTVPLASPLPTTNSLTLVSVSAPIAVTAAVGKGPFVPPDDLLRAKVEIGWKGSAATSAFRPAEPRKVQDMPTIVTHPHDVSLVKQSRPLFDFDLNVAEEAIADDAVSQSSPPKTASLYDFRGNNEKAQYELIGSAPAHGSGGLGLDLNSVDETSTDGTNLSTSNGRKIDVGEHRDFDLNDEPVVDASEPSTSGQRYVRNSMLTHQQQISRAHVNGAEMGSFSTWFHPGSSYSAVTIPTVMPDRREQSFPIVSCPPRMMGPSAGGIQFNPEIYRGPVLSSSPGLPFPSTPFQYSVLPYGNSFPLPSSTLPGSPAAYADPSLGGRLGFPSVHSPLMGAAGPVTSHFSHPYTVSLADGNGNSFIENSKKWSRQGLDLNAGPGGAELDGRDETSSLGQRQLPAGSPYILSEEQARLFQASSGLLKRKEPEGGWDGYRQSSWQQ